MTAHDTHASRITAARFDAAACSYDSYADVQARVGRALAGFLDLITVPEQGRILDVGCGTGLFTGELCGRYPERRIEAVDISAAMIKAGRARLFLPASKVQWLHADVRELPAAADCALVTASSALQWLEPLPAALQHLSLMLQPGGSLLCALMIDGTLKELHELRRHLFPHKPYGLRLPCPDDVISGLTTAGLKLIRTEISEIQVQKNSAAELLKSLNALGVTPALPAAPGTRLNRGELRKLQDAYDRFHAAPDGGVCATYLIQYFHGLKI